MVISPAQQQILWTEIHQLLQSLPIRQQRCYSCPQGDAIQYVYTSTTCALGFLKRVCTWFVGTFIAAQLYLGEQSDLDDLPEEPEHQILSADVHDLAADGRGGVQSQVQILLLGVEVVSSELEVVDREEQEGKVGYQSRMPSLTAPNRASVAGLMGRMC
ncbi:hypothetical protein EYF80_023775 [Liparis tanakae]|uniref:Uncharacterized protein n=1 Tax=Liparis tanakae TaxID=230148 RepID=A0A4Z2HJC6_9TELE|nr:hypothetical protein EYF80_023775 [Liparis tanakae]